MKKGEKVGSITKENYKQVVGRAAALREKLREHHSQHNGFPSLRYIIEKWGFNMSLKALCRHRTAVMSELGVESVGKPTHVLPRPKKKRPAATEPATTETATTETATTEPAATEQPAEVQQETQTEE